MVNGTSSTSGTNGQTPETAVPTRNAMGKDAFLALLVTQMQNQNPLQPQADGEFLAQLAQFSSLEQLQEIRSDMSSLREIFEAAMAAGAATTDSAQGGA